MYTKGGYIFLYLFLALFIDKTPDSSDVTKHDYFFKLETRNTYILSFLHCDFLKLNVFILTLTCHVCHADLCVFMSLNFLALLDKIHASYYFLLSLIGFAYIFKMYIYRCTLFSGGISTTKGTKKNTSPTE